MMLTKPKLIKKLDKKLIKKKLMIRAKQVVYARDGNKCKKCWTYCTGSNRHASHIIPVSWSWRLALYPINMKVLCYHCHINRWHKNPLEAWERFSKTFPERKKQLLELKDNIPMGSITLTELEEIEKIIEIEENSLALQKNIKL